MRAELPVRGIRVGGVTVGPGEARAIALPLAARRATDGVAAARAIPVWVVVGAKAGPRVSVVAALRGVETSAARAAIELAAGLDPAALHGSVVVVPVLRPEGRLSRRGRTLAAWRFPGDAGGKRAERDAFAVFSDVVVGAQALLVLGAPRRGRRGVVVARGRVADPRVKRLALGSGAVAVVAPPAKPGGLLAAAAAAQIPVLELSAEGEAGDPAPVAALARATRAALDALGLFGKDPGDAGRAPGVAAEPPATTPLVVERPVYLEAPGDGFLEAPAAPGTIARARAQLGLLAPGLPGSAVKLESPIDGLVIEAAAAGPVRSGATLFGLVPLSRPSARRLARAPAGAGAVDADGKTRVGWVEEVTLPGLGIERLKAKIDTGARTSALHVARMRTVDTTGGPHRRPILEITVPGGGRGQRAAVVRAAVREFTSVRDTSGRTERRPVIETVLRLGPIKRRIAVTLTNRGDMLFPMLIGRTALGPGIVVDPARRYLLRRDPERVPRPPR
jgi:predicted deacylase